MMNKPNNPTQQRRSASASAGFTLVEVLLSLGVFAIGMIAVASLFPVAAILQRETAQEVISENAANSAEALINARQLSYYPPDAGATPPRTTTTGQLRNYYNYAGPTGTSAVALNDLDPDLLRFWMPPGDRSYPTSQVIYGPPTDITNCDLHWVPFVQDLSGDPTGTNQTWVVRLFLLEADSRANYPNPGVESNCANPGDPATFPKVVWTSASSNDNVFTLGIANHGLQPGDIIMDNNGNEHRITEVNGRVVTVLNKIPGSPTAPTVVWFAPPYGASSSPARRILTVSIDVDNTP